MTIAIIYCEDENEDTLKVLDDHEVARLKYYEVILNSELGPLDGRFCDIGSLFAGPAESPKTKTFKLRQRVLVISHHQIH